ncbi:TlpA family protein disulfide reductase [Streptomyces beihaiensis]|uniref:TlpA family protein disulfide reductase n=1 Tax=Streptomyces beihaiensis TaxID=2984495 RepID=A0ABT3TZ83_9ACTN|nr:TlpA disulfide reductase family protein [Streptomyces beihaiensis]MCX3061288.1 TlpA family protein disulfide reductase [Streptomyces beihaiensis]
MSAACRAPRTTATKRRAAQLTVGAAVVALALTACSSGGTSGGGNNTNFVTGSGGIDTVKKGDRHDAPDLKGKSLEGKQLDTADYKGKVLVLNVWGSWCPPCRAEAPNFAKVAKDTKSKGVQFLGINTRDTSTSPAKEFEKDKGIPYPSFYDPTGKLLLRFEKGTLNPQAIPSTIVVDREGKIAARSLKPLSESSLREMLAPIIAEK